MQWSSDRNAGFSRANPQRLILPVVIDPEYHYESINVEAQQNNSASLLWWTKRLVALRKQFQAFGRGSIEFLNPANHRVLAFVRQWHEETILVVVNLSRFAQYVELDLSQFRGLRPRELFGQTAFPLITDSPYLLTLSPHAFYWLALERTAEGTDQLRALQYEPPQIECNSAEALLGGEERALLEDALPAFMQSRPWLPHHEHRLTSVIIRESLAVGTVRILLVDVTFNHGVPETYVLPVSVLGAADGRTLPPTATIATLRTSHGEARLIEALEDPPTARAFLATILGGHSSAGLAGTVHATPLAPDAHLEATPEGDARNIGPAHASAAIQYGDRYLLKVFRHLEEGMSPELEMHAFLAKRVPHLVPGLAGVVEYRRGRGEPSTLAVLQKFVPNEGTAWTQAREELRRYYERVLTLGRDTVPPPVPREPITTLAAQRPPAEVATLMGVYLDLAAKLGRRTAELHLALASDSDDPAFAPEPYTPLDVRSKYQTLRNLVGKTLRLLRARAADLPPQLAEPVARLLDTDARVLRSFETFLKQKLEAHRIRIHGDYHLAQILNTGREYVIIDFEGGRDRGLPERRRKRSPLRDVAGMLRSFHSGAFSVLFDPQAVRKEDHAALLPWADHWQQWAGASFLRVYLDTVGNHPIVPPEPQLTLPLENLSVEMAFRDLLRDLEAGNDLSIPLHALVESMHL